MLTYNLLCFYLVSSTSGTPSKVKSQPSQDVEPAGRVRRGRKTTEEEEGEIVSDASDTEAKRGGKRRRHSLPKDLDKEGATEGGFDSDQSDSESRKSDKQRKYPSTRVSDTDERPKGNETGSDVSDLEDRKHDQQRKHSSPHDVITEEKVKPTDPEGKGKDLASKLNDSCYFISSANLENPRYKINLSYPTLDPCLLVTTFSKLFFFIVFSPSPNLLW